MLWRAVFVEVFFMLCAAQLLIAEGAQRIRGNINDDVRTYLCGQIPPLARHRWDIGRAPASLPMNGVSLVFKRSAEQRLDLERLLSQQGDPASPLYQHWLSPEAFADRFGVSLTDRRKVEDWLRAEGLSLDEHTSSATSLRFSGTVTSLEHAFGTEFHIFRIEGHDYVANVYELSVPAAMIPVVEGFRNLNTFPVKAREKVANHRANASISHPDYRPSTPFQHAIANERPDTQLAY